MIKSWVASTANRLPVSSPAIPLPAAGGSLPIPILPIPALPLAVDQIGQAVADPAGDQQRRKRVLVDIAAEILTSTAALLVERIARRCCLLARPARQILRRRTRIADGGPRLLPEIAHHVARLLGHAALFRGRIAGFTHAAANRPALCACGLQTLP